MTFETHAGAIDQQVTVWPGPPTMDELRVHYPARFTWLQLKAFVYSGYVGFQMDVITVPTAFERDLGLLKRDKRLQRRYDEWAIRIKKEYGSVIGYLLNHRLQWGKPDTLSLLTSALDSQTVAAVQNGELEHYPTPEYFKADIPFNSDLISIIRNDWPYSVPPEIEHFLVWTRVPIFHSALISPAINARVQQDGLWGFTGSTDTLESLPSLESCLPTLSDWGITMDKLIRSPSASETEETMVKNAGKEVRDFVKRKWKENQWETAWFVNPPRLQSIPDLAHIHVFARKKTAEEEPTWCC